MACGTGTVTCETIILQTASREERFKYKYGRLKLQAPRNVRLPPPLGPPFPILGEPLDAFVCDEEECGYISISRPVIAQHYNTKHGWHSSKDDREHWIPAKAQTFFKAGGFQRYFTVLPSAAEPAVLRAPAAVHDTEVTTILSEYEEAKAKRKRGFKTADSPIAKTDRTGWFNHNGWPEHLARRNLGHLSCASRMPDHREHALQQAAKVVELAIEQSVAGLSTLAQETRRWLKSASREEIDQRPLARLQNPEGRRRYAGYMKRFVCYCLRVAAVSDEDPACRPSRRGGSLSSDADLSGDEQENRESYRILCVMPESSFPGMGTRDN